MLSVNLRQSFNTACMAAATYGLAACATYPVDPGYGGGVAGPPTPSAPVAATANIEGCWAFTNTKGVRHVNYVEALDAETILVGPVNSNKVFQYYHIGNGVFQAESGSATYRFNGRMGSWNSNKTPPTTYRLSYAGFNC